MSLQQIATYLLLWSLIGIFLFSLIVIYLFRSGRVYDSRDEEGHLKKEMPLKGILTMLGFLLLIVAFLTFTNYLSLVRQAIFLGYWQAFLLNLGLILILIIYDSLVIDWFVIALWRPAFLQLPDEMNRESMKEHLRRTLIVSPVFAVLIALLSSLATHLIF